MSFNFRKRASAARWPRIGGESVHLALCLLLSSRAVLAQQTLDLTEVPFEQLMQREVVSASKMARQISDSPSAVAIVTADDIRAYGYRTIADVINSMRGLYTTSDRRYQYMGGRGFGAPGDYAGRIMVLIDGYATQDNLFNQAYIDESGLLDLALVERVEYVPGTGSVTYGNNALLGIINIVTRKGGDFNATQLSGEVASHGSARQRVSFGKRFDNGADLLLSASSLDARGQNLYFPAYDAPATNNGMAEGIDGEHNKRVFGKLSYEGWNIEGGYVDRRKNVPTNPTRYTAFNSAFPVEDENAFLNARYETDLGLRLHTMSSLYYGYYAYGNHREYTDYAADQEKYGHRRFDGQWWGFDQKFVGNWFANHTLVFGFEFRNDFLQRFVWDYLYPSGTVKRSINNSFTRQTTSFYAADEFRFSDRWWLNFGARYDNANDLAGNWSPRLALIFKPAFQTTLKASYSEAFRMPNVNERSPYVGYSSAAAPEHVAASELVLQHQFSPGIRLTGSLYHYHRTKQMVKVGANYVAAGSSETHGLELELERIWESGVRTRGSLAWQNAHGTDGNDLVNSPDLLGKFNLSFPFLGDALRAGFEAQYIGSRLTYAQRKLDGVGLANLTFSSERKWHGLSASFSVRNLFDREYEAVSPFSWRPASGLLQDTLRMDGRTYWFQLNYDL